MGFCGDVIFVALRGEGERAAIAVYREPEIAAVAHGYNVYRVGGEFNIRIFDEVLTCPAAVEVFDIYSVIAAVGAVRRIYAEPEARVVSVQIVRDADRLRAERGRGGNCELGFKDVFYAALEHAQKVLRAASARHIYAVVGNSHAVLVDLMVVGVPE